jgi:hypothetical protein
MGELLLGALEVLLGREERELPLVGLVARALEGRADLRHPEPQGLLRLQHLRDLIVVPACATISCSSRISRLCSIIPAATWSS